MPTRLCSRCEAYGQWVGFVTDAESGQLAGMDVLVERDSDGFVRWLSGYVSRFGVESMVTDDLNTYKPVVEHLGVDHQVCIAHNQKVGMESTQGDRWVGQIYDDDMASDNRVAQRRRTRATGHGASCSWATEVASAGGGG